MKISVEKEPGRKSSDLSFASLQTALRSELGVRAALDSRARMVVVPIESSFKQRSDLCLLMAEAVVGEMVYDSACIW